MDKKIAKDMENITSIPEVGRITALAILGETNGFEVNSKQTIISQLCWFGCCRKDFWYIGKTQN